MPDDILVGIEGGSEAFPGTLTFFDDLHAIRMHMWGSLLGPKSYIFQRWREGFERPTFLIQSLNQAWVPKNSYQGQVDHSFLVEFYALDQVSAMRVAGDLMMLFATPGNGLVCPYWDMTQDPPVVQMDREWEKYGFAPNSVPRMGVRVMQETITINNEQEDNEVADVQDWTVSMTFRALAPRVLYDLSQEKLVTECKLSGLVTGSSAGFVSG